MKTVFPTGLAMMLSALTLDCAAVSAPEHDAGLSSSDAGLDAGVPVGTEDGGRPPPDAGLPLKSACAVLNTTRCEYLQRCGLISPSNSAMRDCLAWQQATSCGP